MRYFVLSPEVAGSLGKNAVISREQHPPIVSQLHYELDVWLGDELLEAFPCFIVTVRVADAVAKAQLSGVRFSVVEVSLSEQFNELYPDRPMPTFVWLQASGTPGHDDFGADPAGRLVISETALRLLQTMNLNHCDVTDFG